MTSLTNTAFPITLKNIQMLLWRLDLTKRSFANLNDCPLGVLGRENYRFFKDSEYRSRILFPDDRVVMDRAMSCFKDRTPVKLVFRVLYDNKTYWYKLTGWPTSDRRYYEGVVEDISEHISWLRDTFDQQGLRLSRVESESYPVAVFADGGSLVSANAAFYHFIKVNPGSLGHLSFDGLFAAANNYSHIFEQMLTERSLTTELSVRLAGHVTTVAICRLEFFYNSGQSYIRLAVVDQLDKQNSQEINRTRETIKVVTDLVCEDLEQCLSIDAMLERIYAAKDLFPGMDVVMFSDIYARKNKVIVYSCGELDEPLEQGSQFPYAGTIAENIEKENLKYLIVEDTLSSIKAIDWVLFVPKGILSYVAKALHVRGAMRTVLILCSKEKDSFSESQVADVEKIAEAFHRQLKRIRKLNR